MIRWHAEPQSTWHRISFPVCLPVLTLGVYQPLFPFWFLTIRHVWYWISSLSWSTCPFLKKYKNPCRLYKFLIYVFIAHVFCNSHILYAFWSLAYLYLNSYNWVCLWKNCPRIWNNLNFSFFIQRFIYCKTIGYFCCHATLLVLLVKSVSWNLCSSCNL